MPPAGTRSASSEERVWVVPESLRAALGGRYGPVYAGADAERRLKRLKNFATCGDRVTGDALRLGNAPFLAVVDGRTRRKEPHPIPSFGVLAQRRRVTVENPPGMLTESLRRAIRELVALGGGLIEVRGEDDLASLALVESMPVDSTVVYGIPGEGASFVRVDAVAKEQVRSLLALMVRRTVPRSALGRNAPPTLLPPSVVSPAITAKSPPHRRKGSRAR